jgi:hypothetical protein
MRNLPKDEAEQDGERLQCSDQAGGVGRVEWARLHHAGNSGALAELALVLPESEPRGGGVGGGWLAVRQAADRGPAPRPGARQPCGDGGAATAAGARSDHAHR